MAQNNIVRAINIVETIAKGSFRETVSRYQNEMGYYGISYEEVARSLLNELEKLESCLWTVEAIKLLKKVLDPGFYCADLCNSVGGFAFTSDLGIGRFRAEIPVDGNIRTIARHSWDELTAAIETLIEFRIINKENESVTQ